MHLATLKAVAAREPKRKNDRERRRNATSACVEERKREREKPREKLLHALSLYLGRANGENGN
jgi:hypothetical protein